MNLTAFQIALLIFFIYLCTWSLINRICRCIEHCFVAKYSSVLQDTSDDKNNK
jgi:hypothetical protein